MMVDLKDLSQDVKLSKVNYFPFNVVSLTKVTNTKFLFRCRTYCILF